VRELEAANTTIRAQNAELEQRVDEATVALQQRVAQLRLLDEASTILASSLEYETTLQSVARVAVPVLADWCSVDIVEEGQAPRGLAAAHTDPAKEEVLRQLQQRYPPDPQGRQPVSEVLRTRQSVLLADIGEQYLQETSRDDAHLAMRRAIGFRSVMVVPLRAHDRLLGALTFARGSSRQPFEAEDLALAEELARHCALAMDNARLYGEVRQALQARDTFLSVAAHELKTPMTSVFAATQLLRRQVEQEPVLDLARLHARVDLVHQQANKLVRLLDQLLDVSRIEAGQLSLEREPTDLVRVVEEVVGAARTRTDRHTLTHMASAPIVCSVDALRLEQVLTNLLENAMKFSPDGGTIEVGVAARKDGTIQLSVRDHGQGIPPQSRERIFDRFYQGHQDMHASGMGLGLWISREIVALHRGRITVESPPDGGTRFVVILPAEPR
jgi:signal transduction histidine kinase